MGSKGKGWRGDSRRHSLARKGVSTILPDGRRIPVNKYLKAEGLENSKGNIVYTGKVSKQILEFILEKEYDEWKDHYLGDSGYFKDGEIWIAWDNSYGSLSVEEFHLKENAKLYATELDLTHKEIHRKDIRESLNQIANKLKKNEGEFLGDSPISDDINTSIQNYLNTYEPSEINVEIINDIAIIIKTTIEEEKVLLKGDKPTTDYAKELYAEYFTKVNPKGFERSGYYRTFS